MKRRLRNKKSAILTILSCAGVAVTAIMAADGGFKAREVLQEANFIKTGRWFNDLLNEVKLTWKVFIKTDIALVLTVASIVANHNLTKRQIAALTAAAGMSGRLVTEYSDKIKERFGQETLDEIRSSIAEDHEDGIQLASVVSINHADISGMAYDEMKDDNSQLIYDIFNNTWFYSCTENVRVAMYHLNRNFQLGGCVSLGDLYDLLGIKSESDIDIDMIGWGTEFVEGGCIWIDYELTKSTEKDYYILNYTFAPEDLTCELCDL